MVIDLNKAMYEINQIADPEVPARRVRDQTLNNLSAAAELWEKSL
jgi:hypothetical protein